MRYNLRVPQRQAQYEYRARSTGHGARSTSIWLSSEQGASTGLPPVAFATDIFLLPAICSADRSILRVPTAVALLSCLALVNPSITGAAAVQVVVQEVPCASYVDVDV